MLDKLQKLLPVPESPIDVDESVYQKNVKALGTELPDDFLAYSRIYGSGTISVTAYSWEIYSAFRPVFPKYAKDFYQCHDTYRKAMETEGLALGLFPEPGGLLPFGHRDDLCFTWETEGNPNEWKVVLIWLYEENGYMEYDLSFTQFLVNLLKGKVKVPGFKSTWNPKTDISFESKVYGW